MTRRLTWLAMDGAAASCAAAVGALLAVMVAAGCATLPESRPGVGDGDSPRRPLGVGEHGLEMRTWIIEEDAERVVEALRPWIVPSSHDDESAGDADGVMLQTDAMSRNGLRWAKVPLEELDRLGEELGGLHRNVLTWHGQQHRWTPVHHHRIRSGGEAVAIDGRLRRFDEGQLRLMLRGWTLATERGPRFYIELMPMHRPPGRAVDHPLLDRQPTPDEPFTTMGLHAMLGRGVAYVLTGESPEMNWDDERDDADAPLSAGPDADLPGDFGDTMFRTRSTPQRRVLLVFIAHIPESLQPPPLEQAASSPPGERSGS